MFDTASGPDLLRLLSVPFFAYVAWLDIRTRRVPNRTWLPLLGLAVVALAWDILRVWTGAADPVVLVALTVSVGFVVPLAYLFWRLGGFGGADAKAFFVVALLLPAYPTYRLGDRFAGVFDAFPGATYLGTLPLVQPELGVFSVTVLSNTVVLGALYPVALAARNLAVGALSPGMFVAKPVRWDRVTDAYGRLLEPPDRRLRDVRSLSGLSAAFTLRGVDLDAVRMYLRWRGLSLAALREQPDRYRHPASLPAEPNDPGDGAVPVDGWDGPPQVADTDGGRPYSDAEPWGPEARLPVGEDPWGAERFLAEVRAYGATPEQLREGLETLAEDEVVRVSPGIPFLVPLFFGLVTAFVYGDLLFALFEAAGLGP